MPVASLDRCRIVLVQTSLAANIGAAARAMLTMGLTRLTLVAPKTFPHPDATALAAGAAKVLDDARVVATLDEALEDARSSIALTARPRRFAGRVLALRDAAREAVGAAAQGDVAFVFGTEMSGLTNEQVLRCNDVATIAANPEYASLNLAAAVQLVAWELRMAATGGEVPVARRFAGATHDEIEALYAHAMRTLEALGFYDPARPRRLLARLRRLFARASLEREEVNILRGILARVDEACGVERARQAKR
jgi:tRNA/rRNA methyltransferase